MRLEDNKVGTFIDLTDKYFGEWHVKSYLGKQMWECECSCGKIKNINGADLRKGKSTSCGHTRKDNLVGKEFQHLKIVEYLEDNKYHYRCECKICGKEFIVHTYHLEHNNIPKCNHGGLDERIIDITDQYFGEWHVDSYAGNKMWNCTCSCGTKQKIKGKDLRSGLTTQCKHHNIQSLLNQEFGNWKVIEQVGNNDKWVCECKCENHTRKVLKGSYLRNGESRSCGCKSYELTRNTLKMRYGDTATARANNPREEWQIDIVENPEKFKQYLETFSSKPSAQELERLLNTRDVTLLRKIHKYGLENYVVINDISSELEKELLRYVESIYNKAIEHNIRNILPNNREIDILLKDDNIGIEFNGTYWHSDIVKGTKYHQQKTIDCIRNNIRLIHIFEHEWINNQDKIKEYLRNILCNNQKIYARQTEVVKLTTAEERDFEEKYHLQGCTPSAIALGIKYNNELIGLMTFGTPRFNQSFQYELIRLCYKTGINVVGGSERLLSHFISDYNPSSIVSYCNLSKFDGNTYLRLGFKTDVSMLTEPNYVWVKPESKTNYEVLTRYQTQKHKLIEKNLGSYGNTEDEIMKNLGYFKVYDSGNMRFEWYS